MIIKNVIIFFINVILQKRYYGKKDIMACIDSIKDCEKRKGEEMFSVMISSAIAGMKSFMVNVEVDVSNGLPGFEIVGMAAGEVKEAKERVRVALKNIGIVMPPKKITVNLSPASLRKTGTALDLPIAVGILTSMEILPPDAAEGILFMGELGLNGELKFVSGVLPSAMMAEKNGIKTCIVPKCNEMEGTALEKTSVMGFESLPDILEFLYTDERGRKMLCKPKKILWPVLIQ